MSIGKHVLLVWLLSICLFANAQTITSTTTGGNWSSGTTWIGGSAPAAGQAAVIDGPVSVDVNTQTITDLTINSGKTLTVSGTNSITLTGDFTNSGGTFTAGSGTVHFASTGNNTQNIAGTSAMSFFSLSCDAKKGVTITNSATQTVTSLLTLAKAAFTTNSRLSISSGATVNIADNKPSISAAPSGGPWDVVYNPGGNFTTGNELNSTPRSITCQSGTVSLNTAITVSSGGSGINVTGGTFDSKTFTINSTPSLSVSNGATFKEPSTSVTVTGNLSIAGTYTGAGALIFAGGTTQSISGATASSATFKNISIVNNVTTTTVTTTATSLTLTGNFANSGTFTAPATTFTVGGTLTNSGTYTAGTTTTVTGAFTNNGSSTFNAGSALTLSGNFANSGTFTHNNGTVTFTSNAVQSVSGSNAIFYNVTVSKNGTNAVTFGVAETITNNLTLTSGRCTVNAVVTMNNSSAVITLTAGTLTINSSPSQLLVASGTTINVTAGTIANASPNGGPWILNYVGAGAVTTGFEIPTSPSTGSLTSVTVSGSGTVTLNKALAIAGTPGFTQSAGTFLSSTNTISTTKMTLSGGNFIAPSTTLTLTSGDLALTGGTYSNNGGTLVFAGNNATTGAQTISGIGAGTTSFNSITINSNAKLTSPTASPATLTLAGTLQNDGTFDAGAGTVSFEPTTTASQIKGNNKIIFYNISVSNSTPSPDLSLATSAGADLTNILDVGSAVFDTGGNTFTLLSSGDKPTVDASIAAIDVANGGGVTGDVTVQRYMQRIGDGTDLLYPYQVWRNISSPLADLTVAKLQLSIPITWDPSMNISGTPSTVTGASAMASMFTYDESVNTGNLDDGWAAFPVASGSSSDPLVRGQGYSVFLFGKDSETPPSSGKTLIPMTGAINSGQFDLPVTQNGSGWNLVGNPYPSSIDWNSSGWINKTGVDATIHLEDYNTGDHGGYSVSRFVSCLNGQWSNGTDQGGACIIPTGQAFWVYATSSPTVTIDESVKATVTNAEFFRQSAPVISRIRTTLISSDNMRDETVIYFADGATLGFDSQLDGKKLMNRNGYLNLSSLINGEKYVFNALPISDCSKAVNLDVSDVVTGSYSLNFSDYANMPSSVGISLKDNFKNTTTDVRQTQSYSFDIDENNAATFGSGRFSIVFNYSIAPAVTSQAQSICDPLLAQVVVKNTSSEFNYSIVSPADGSEVASAVSGTGNDLTFALSSGSVTNGNNQYQVRATNKVCTSLMSTGNVSLLFVAKPVAPTTTSAQTCGAGIVTLAASGAPTDGHYSWYDTQDAINPYATQTSTLTTESISKDRTYYVASVNSLGCEGPRTMVTAKVVTLTLPTIIVVDLNTLQSDYDAGIQWYLNDQLILGATSKTLHVTQSGVYKLSFTSQGCTVSTEKQFAVTGVENLPGESVNVYPNPVAPRGSVIIEVAGSDEVSGTLLNALGVTVNSIRFTNGGTKQVGKHDFTTESSGIYFVKINQGNKVAVVRIIKE